MHEVLTCGTKVRAGSGGVGLKGWSMVMVMVMVMKGQLEK